MIRSPVPKPFKRRGTRMSSWRFWGITSELEGEEMPVSEEGFKGGDRTSIDLPKPEEDLLEAEAAAGKPVVLVLANGRALAVNWANQHVNAILESWYPGEEGGTAIAQTLSGANNPAGRLPVTFYTGVDQLPPFEDYAMKGRTYRYFAGEPQNVRFEFKDRDLSMVTEAGEPIIAEGKYSLSIGGGQPATGAPTVSATFQVKGRKTLPE